MKMEVRVEASVNEKRRFLGGADITPMVELVSIMVDTAMLAVVDARLEALTGENAAADDRRDER